MSRRMMKRMIMLRLRKMRWRLMMLRRRTDPKTGTHALCEPAQSKCTWACCRSIFFAEKYR